MEWSKRVSSAWPPQGINDNNDNENDNEKGGNDKDRRYQRLQETWKGQERNQAVPLLQERTRYQRQSTMCLTGSGWSSTFERKNSLILSHSDDKEGVWGADGEPGGAAHQDHHGQLHHCHLWGNGDCSVFSIFSRFFPMVAMILHLFFICFWQ